MTSDLKVTLVQKDLAWENPSENLRSIEHLLETGSVESDLIILPEMFNTGFSMNARKLAETENGTSLAWMKRLAKKFNAAFIGSIISKEDEQYYNRLYFVEPNGTFEKYDKRHLFSFANETDHFTAGTQRLIINHKCWRICPLVCYDLRFPVWSRNADLKGSSANHEYDLLIYVANWPEARRQPWLSLLEARAHENQAYVAGVNRVGVDGNNIEYSGDSQLFSPKGELLSSIQAKKECVETVSISMSDLKQFREKFTAWKDKDSFNLLS